MDLVGEEKRTFPFINLKSWLIEIGSCKTIQQNPYRMWKFSNRRGLNSFWHCQQCCAHSQQSMRQMHCNLIRPAQSLPNIIRINHCTTYSCNRPTTARTRKCVKLRPNRPLISQNHSQSGRRLDHSRMKIIRISHTIVICSAASLDLAKLVVSRKKSRKYFPWVYLECLSKLFYFFAEALCVCTECESWSRKKSTCTDDEELFFVYFRLSCQNTFFSMFHRALKFRTEKVVINSSDDDVIQASIQEGGWGEKKIIKNSHS